MKSVKNSVLNKNFRFSQINKYILMNNMTDVNVYDINSRRK